MIIPKYPRTANNYLVGSLQITHQTKRLACINRHSMMSKYTSLISTILLCSEGTKILAVSSSSSSSSLPTIPVTTSSSQSITSDDDGPFTTNTVASYLRNRCGSSDLRDIPALWSYEGTLTDPTTGKIVALVEGLELVKALPMIKPTQLSGIKGMHKLSAMSLLRRTNSISPNKQQQWDAAVTILSRRLFCYRRPKSTSIETKKSFSPYNSLLTSVRLRPDGPLRHLLPSESIAYYDTAVTYILRNNGKEMLIFSERSNAENDDDGTKHYVMGSVQLNSSSSNNRQLSSSTIFDFAVNGQKGISKHPILPPLKVASRNVGGSEEIVISPPRSRLLQFGKGDGNVSSSERKYGSVRETYSYSVDSDRGIGDSSRYNKVNRIDRIKQKIGMKKERHDELTQPQEHCSVHYTRYGEAPPWYAPGRSCTLELRGERSMISLHDGMEDTTNRSLPPLASWIASKCNFLSGWPSVFTRNPESIDLMKKQYYQLPQCGSSETEITDDTIEQFFSVEHCPSIRPLEADWPVAEHKQWLTSAENTLSRMQSCMRRLSKSFIVSELPRKASQ